MRSTLRRIARGLTQKPTDVLMRTVGELAFESLEPRKLLTAVVDTDGILQIDATDTGSMVVITFNDDGTVDADDGDGNTVDDVEVDGINIVNADDDEVEINTTTDDDKINIRRRKGDDIRVTVKNSDGKTHVDIVGGAEDLTINADDGDDKITAKKLKDTLGDTLELNGEDGEDKITVKNQEDGTAVDISGGDGNDNLSSKAEATIDGGDGDDKIRGGKGDDVLDGGNGNDRLLGAGGDDLLLGGADDDVLLGGGGNDGLDGGAGDDRLKGGGGGDLLVGQAGDDILIGGGGDDNAVSDDDDTRVRGASEEANGMFFTASLEPGQVVPTGMGADPEGVSEASGTAFLTLNEGMTELTYRLVLTGVDLDGNQTPDNPDDDVTGLHIHVAAMGANGPHTLNIFGAPGEDDADLVVNAQKGTLEGIWDDGDATGAAPGDSKALTAFLTELAAGDLFFQMHTVGFPSPDTGELRGQIEDEFDAFFDVI